jgi:signal transduction histidine kinase
VGFDTKQQKSLAETHIGLRNVKDRVEQMCGGTMTLSSTVGEGTIVRIYIPAASGAEKEDRRK